MQDEPYALLPLGKGEANTRVSLEDYERLSKKRWWHNPSGYAVASNGRRKNPLPLHRHVLGLGSGDGGIVDHINRNTLDNRRSNLRLADHRANSQNVSSHEGSSSRYRGVSYAAARDRWLASGKWGGKSRGIGRYKTELEAAKAAEAARRKHMQFSVPDTTLDPVGKCQCFECRGYARPKLRSDAKLTPELVRYIRASPASSSSIARELEVSHTCIGNVRTGRTWTSVDAEAT